MTNDIKNDTKEKIEKKIEQKAKAKKDKSEKISKFSQKLSQLRRERNISQKKAANDLGISQALLSHYEKGIRECGLDFLIKCCEYYNVTADYMLGISEKRNGISSAFTAGQADGSKNDMAVATNFIIDTIDSLKDNAITDYIVNYYTLCFYRGALTMAKAGILPKDMFKIDISIGKELASAAIAVSDAKFAFIEDKSRTGADEAELQALQGIISNAEEILLKTVIE